MDIGDYSGKEINFVARKGNEIKYYQVKQKEIVSRETYHLFCY